MSKHVRSLTFESNDAVEGFLDKRTPPPLKRWQKRYFVIEGQFLKYFMVRTT